MTPEPDVDGDSDSSLSSIPSDVFNDTTIIANHKSPPPDKAPSTPHKMPEVDDDGSAALGPDPSQHQTQEEATIFVADTITIPADPTGEDQQNSRSPPPKSIAAKATRSSTRPKRVTIKVIENQEPHTEEPESEDEIMAKGKTNGSARSLLQNKWTEQNVLTSSKKSPLSGKNLRDILASDPACDALPPMARAEILSMLPAQFHKRDPKDDQIKPNAFALKNCDDFRADTVRFVDDLESGYHTVKFLEDAAHAHWQRSSHQRDGEAVKAFKHEWGVDLPEEVLPAGVKSGRLREISKPVDMRKVPKNQAKQVLLEAKAAMEDIQKLDEDKKKESEVAEADRPVPMTRYAPPKPGKPKHRIAMFKAP